MRIKPNASLGLLAAGTLAILGCGEGVKEEQKKRPNIVLIMADDVCPFHFSTYKRINPVYPDWNVSTPNIDKLAAAGMIFDRAYTTASASTPSRYSTLTGQYPGRCDSKEFKDENPAGEPYCMAWNTPISENSPTLHKLLLSAGYFTGFVGKFHIGELEFDDPSGKHVPSIDENIESSDPNCDKAMLNYQKILQAEIKRLTGANFAASILWENSSELPVAKLRNHNLEWLTRGVAQFLDSTQKNGPFFLHFNTTALHGPNHDESLRTSAKYTPQGTMTDTLMYHPDRKSIYLRLEKMGIKFDEKTPDWVKHYYVGILYLDDQIGVVLKLLKDKGLDENTVVILAADNGIEPGKSTCYEMGVNIPLIVKYPGITAKGSRSSALISFADLFPTLAEIGGAKMPQNIKFDGMSIVEAMKGHELKGRDHLYMEMGYTRAIVTDKFKYIAMRYPKKVSEEIASGKAKSISHFGAKSQVHASVSMQYMPNFFDADQLYDLSLDSYEQKNLATEVDYSSKLSEMKGLLQKELQSTPYPFDLADIEIFTHPNYLKLAAEARKLGSSIVPWWKRNIIFPPK